MSKDKSQPAESYDITEEEAIDIGFSSGKEADPFVEMMRVFQDRMEARKNRD